MLRAASCIVLLVLFLPAFAGSNGTASQQAIASAHPLATRAGIEVLDAGGNAFDAAVTVAAVLAVVEPYGSGLGGGGFWLLHRAKDRYQVMIDGRERAPLAAHRDMYLDADGDVLPRRSVDGALAAGIPGQVAAMVHISSRYGRLPLKRLLQPAIRLARQGFAVESRYRRMARFRLQALRDSPAAKNIFLSKGELPATGAIIKQPDLADTLQRIADKGHAGFYAGASAKLLVDGVRQAGGIWTLQDLQQYKIVERPPVVWRWHGLSITLASLPSSGGIVMAQILNQLELLGWSKLDPSTQWQEKTHLLIEAMRRAYHNRALYLGDSDYVSVDVAGLTDKAHAESLLSDFSKASATASEMLPEAAGKTSEGQDTTHYSILDRAGNRVSATLSINYPFGSGFVPPGTGVLLNDEMDDFSVSPGVPNVYGLVGNEANAIAPGKRMLSSMSPSFVESEDRLMIVGTPGGSRIITMVLQAILAFDAGLDAAAIVKQPRLHHQYLPDHVQLEPGALTAQQKKALQELGHTIRQLDRRYGNMQLIIQDKHSGVVQAASDPRGIGRSMVD